MLPKTAALKKTIYLDNAATTPLDARVLAAMRPFWQNSFGNPSSLYHKGREAYEALEGARKTVAGFLSCQPAEVIFTAGGTESINLAIFGVARSFKPSPEKKYHLITSTIEHHAVLHPIQDLEKDGYAATYVSVDKQGFVKLSDLKASVRPETILISIMYANNEIGTIEPIAEIGKWLSKLNRERAKKGLPKIYFHTDACQAAGYLDLNVQKLGVDLLTANGSKMYGPKQTGCLYAKAGTPLKSLVHGGGQEAGRRSGTENVPGIIGFAKAFEVAQKKRANETKRLKGLRDYFINKVLKTIPNTSLNGAGIKGDTRLPNNINISFDHADGEALLLYLDSYGVCVSTGSACSAKDTAPSHVLRAIGTPFRHIRGAIRFTLGKDTAKKDLDFVLKVLTPLVKELRQVNK